MYLWTTKNRLNSGYYPSSRSGCRNLLKDSCEMWQFSTIWLIFLEKLIRSLCLSYPKSSNVLSNLDLLNTFSSNDLNFHQSAYRKHHFTETALLYIHDHLINAIGSQKISCLCLLDLSTAFNTIDHILITHLSSWFALHGSVIAWFISHLSDRCFRVKCDSSLSSSHTCFCGVSQGSVLGSWSFSLRLVHHST